MKFSIALLAAALAFAASSHAAPPETRGNQSNHVNHTADHSDHSGHAQGGQGQGKAKKPGGNQYAGKPCPPGLAKKNPGCVPPGQWKKGDRLPESWIGHYTAYNLLPEIFRNRYANRTDRRFVYQDGRVFVVDAATRAVVDVLTR